MVVKSGERITVRLVREQTSPEQQRELGLIVRYFIRRVERDLGRFDSWVVHIAPALGGYVSHIAVCQADALIEDQGNGQDAAQATWDAICRIEPRLVERSRR